LLSSKNSKKFRRRTNPPLRRVFFQSFRGIAVFERPEPVRNPAGEYSFYRFRKKLLISRKTGCAPCRRLPQFNFESGKKDDSNR
jgi:hypothetical protein